MNQVLTCFGYDWGIIHTCLGRIEKMSKANQQYPKGNALPRAIDHVVPRHIPSGGSAGGSPWKNALLAKPMGGDDTVDSLELFRPFKPFLQTLHSHLPLRILDNFSSLPACQPLSQCYAKQKEVGGNGASPEIIKRI